MEIQHLQSDNYGSFFVETNNKKLAELVYSLIGLSMMVIEHTEVDPSLRGKNIGLQLVNKAAAYARQNHMKIKATCTFAKKVFEKNQEEYKDLLF